MLAKTRRRLDMGTRVLEFTRLHPDTSPAFVAAAARLQERLARAGQLAHQFMDGRSAVHVATARKGELRRLIKRTHLHHLASVAEVASVEEPGLARRFVLPSDATTYRGFQTAASGLAAEAENRKDLLLKHGLAEEVLTGLQVALDQFETAVEQGAAGRLTHVGARSELNTVGEDVVQIVKVMTGLIRVRFASQPELLVEWESASNVVAAPKPEEKPENGATSSSGAPLSTAGDIRPAA
jgi:hypothetical protein